LTVATVFVHRDGEIHHSWSSEVFLAARAEPAHGPRHVDFMWPIWAILDTTPAGRSDDWEPSLAYPPTNG
jgi:predicted dithiol-disulfide oxidoreductase (DUF899 family)